jgi:hypothetical protein
MAASDENSSDEEDPNSLKSPMKMSPPISKVISAKNSSSNLSVD